MTDLTVIESLFKNRFDGVAVTVEIAEGKTVVNGRVAFPVKLSQAFDRSSPITVLDDLGVTIGTLYFLKKNTVDIVQIPQDQYIAFLEEYSFSTLPTSDYIFQQDYFLVDKSILATYLADYKETSALWGSFFHIEDLPAINFSRLKQVNNLTLRKDLFIERDFYKENLAVALAESNPFNRFLKYYHLLEVHFDMHTAEKLKQMIESGNKEKEISKTLKDYNREDIERIKSLFLNKTNPDLLVPYLNEIKNYLPIATSMFYEYGKESNPIKTKKNFDELIALGGFSEPNINKILGNSTYQNKIPQIAAYWIYRIRSSIAHNKLGEYLMTAADEEFIVEFAEPLIKELVIQSYTK
ncbi:hypothetical protein ACFQZS_14780 [Mucilaginibacter calamicampi]|uniref:Apea-like HEPN domain-containing protein n=1 Tax=Mucilaginibacter calamicampi TaxID=1302352 RepID=A0ABW2Z1Q1_9SPHI